MRSSTFRTANRAALAVLTCVATAGFALPKPVAMAGEPVAQQQTAAPVADWAALEATANRDGTVAVIVSLRSTAKPPHALSGPELAAQRAAIAHTRAAVFSELPEKGLRNLKTMDDMPIIAFHADAAQLAKLRVSKHVASVVEDRAIELELPGGDVRPSAGSGTPADQAPALGPGDPSVSGTSSNGSATQLRAWWDYYRMGVDKSRAAGYIGTGQTVAILDTGVDRSHAWLSGRVINEACFATRAIGQTGGDCPNGTWRQYGTGAAAPCTYAWACAHGTHVAHTAAGQHGVAPGARIIAIQVFHRGPTGQPTYWESDLVWAMYHVYSLRSTYRIASVNMSLGGARYTGYCDNIGQDGSVAGTSLTGYVNALKSVGIMTVISSGNDNSSTQVRHPACISNVVSVGNTTLDTSGYDAVYGNVTGGSNSNATLDLLAPGTDICSAVPTWLDNDGTKDGVACGYIGTSMAAPHVAGAAAVLRAARPSATVDQLVTSMRLSGPAVYDSRNGVSRVRINVYVALFK